MKNSDTTCTLISYDQKRCTDEQHLLISEAAAQVAPSYVNWINLETIDIHEITEFASHFNIHPLIIGDITNSDLLPKFEVFDNVLFFSTKMLSYDVKQEIIIEEHLSILMTQNLVITVQEGLPGDVFDQLRGRIKSGMGMIRKYETDFLFYNILNAILEHYIHILENLRSRVEELEQKMLSNTDEKAVPTIIKVKRDIHTLRTYTVPMREALLRMRVEGAGFIKKTSVNYFQDLQDHLHYLVTSFDTLREMLKDLLDIHSSNQNMEMNRIMKTLTIISAIFIPLTFIAGVYGMNFRYMPGLESNWGLLAILVLMGGVSIAMTVYMRFKNWF